jgi:hypothetical protein
MATVLDLNVERCEVTPNGNRTVTATLFDVDIEAICSELDLVPKGELMILEERISDLENSIALMESEVSRLLSPD